ncbi:MAG: HesA/MoeB/ThiF family protein [Nanoarchaeota archaeon]|nr:HesA/MoeB/ThiF family protein [Nanoarchaeota archaeon]
MSRYHAQEVIIGKKGQEKLSKAIVAIIGLGGLGSLSAQLLARAGVNLILIDKDKITIHNLQRQFFSEKDIGKSKAKVMERQIKEINSKIKVKSYAQELTKKNIKELVKADIILDCTDNLETRFLINDFSLKYKVPFIYASAIAERGHVYTIIPKEKTRACFQCIFQKAKIKETCAITGVLNVITAVIAVLQVNQAMKLILGKEIDKELFYFNTETNRFEKIKVKKNPQCLACKGKYKYL